eukprot:TRINITY_DN29827_c0_g1_i3.p1 TRINITY_DN29827_c0_g1~~TRINITY_DN29827_c0_g1_i3.p1  ORF type:complete len:258 (+),score=20.84 TRINITY_DN29827_c0_g1_i3:195-968(+)
MTAVSAQCGQEYAANLAEYVALSGAPTVRSIQFYTDEIAENMMRVADLQVSGCWDLGGLYWEVRLELHEYIRSVLANASTLYPHFSIQADAASALLLPERVLGGLCVPKSCGRSQVGAANVMQQVLPRYIRRIFNSPFGLPPPSPRQAAVRELSRWRHLVLDFVVGGVNSCGTNSLLHNLNKHASIAFTTIQHEDGFFFEDDCILPYAERLEAFNKAAWRRKQEAQQTRYGLRHPGLFANARVRQVMRFRLQLPLVL